MEKDGKRRAMMMDILPYLKEKMSASIGQDLHVVLVTVDSSGDAQAVSTLNRELVKKTFEGLVTQSYLIGGWKE